MKKYSILFTILALFISCKKESIAISKIEGTRISINKNIESDSKIDSLIKPYKDSARHEQGFTRKRTL